MIIEPDNDLLDYCGRIDFDNPKAPEFIFPCSYVRLRFTGSQIKAIVTNKNNYWDNYLGVIVDGVQTKVKLSNDENEKQIILLAEGLDIGEHDVTLFKRQDSCHMFRLHGFVLADDARLCALPPISLRRIEVYGDSVSAGEVSEAYDYASKEDPDWHRGELSNSYYSYAWTAARMLGARIHDIAQGGIALLDKTGWFNAPDYMGMESVYDKLQYNPAFGIAKKWDFERYSPHIVIVAIGQNDNHPDDYMKLDYNSQKSKNWREHYFNFICKLRNIYPKSHIILQTTILNHDENWDRAIDEVYWRLLDEYDDEKIHHYMYTKNGKGTPGHIRRDEAKQMADELCAYINSLGSEVWT